MNSSKIKGSPCPSCNKTLDGLSATDDLPAIPSPGDLTICFYCMTVCMFNHDLSLRLVPAEEIEEMDPESKNEVVRLAAAISLIRSGSRLRK